VMREQMAERIRELGAEPKVQVVLDDSWSTDRITPAGREKLRTSGFAPPKPREAAAPRLVQLQTGVFKCPYCGSTDTRLENIFGPTPCRSLRYCESCRQPFEQFKTI
jgi:ring-1,2-phenylacetyl-CoA epoxidase subunit PaaD